MKHIEPLPFIKIKRRADGVFAIGGVRGLMCQKKGTRLRYFLRYVNEKKERRDYSIGSNVDLKTAREIAAKVRLSIDQGIDPMEVRKAEKRAASQKAAEDAALSMRDAVAAWLESKRVIWEKNNPARARQTEQRYMRHVFPVIGDLKVKNVTPSDLFACVGPLVHKTPNEAKKLETALRQFFRWALTMPDMRPDGSNPIARDGAFGAMIQDAEAGASGGDNHAALPYKQAPAFYAELMRLTSASSRALAFMMLTAARSQAVRLARWSEFDLEGGVWHIPIEHDKVKDKNALRQICLSTAALELLRGMRTQWTRDDDPVFKTSQDTAPSSQTLRQTLKDLHNAKKQRDGIGWIDPAKSDRKKEPCLITAHGFRATFRTWAEEDEHGNLKRFDQMAAEFCLLHSVHDETAKAYRRNKLPNERRMLMEAWGRYCVTGKWPDEE